MSFNPLGEWQPLYHLIYTLIYDCFYYAKFCLQYENCHLGEKKRLCLRDNSGRGSLSISFQCSADKKVWEPLL